jgi:hypothetical protein
MNKRVGRIHVSGDANWLDVTMHYNDSVKATITTRGIDDLRDLRYALEGAICEYENNERARMGKTDKHSS